MRFRAAELTPQRVLAAVRRRVRDVPDLVRWYAPTAETRRNRELLERHRDRHRGERCFVIGNGPSLAKMDLAPLARERTFGMNRIYLLFDKMGFTPTYYTCINELVLEQFHDEIDALDLPKFLNWNRRTLFPGAAGTTAFVRTALGLRSSDTFERDATRSLSSGGTVTMVALQLAYFMGFSEVILIGVDHNFVEKGTPNKTEVRTAETDQSHFHPQYFPRGVRWQLPDLQRSEQAYALARAAFERAGRKILDATVGGRCPVYERVAYEKVVA
jgi:hypothetical protein